MEFKILSLNVRGLNKTTKRRQVFRWLHHQRADIIFLQETYSSPQTIKTWEAEWGGKIIENHGSNHGTGVMILFKPRFDVTTEKIVNDSNGRYILSEVLLDGERFVFLNIYSPNDQAQQIQFLKNLSSSVLNSYANENVVLGGDLNYVMHEIDKRRGRPIIHKKSVIQEIILYWALKTLWIHGTINILTCIILPGAIHRWGFSVG